MKSPKLRDHFFVLAWVALAVIAKYSVTFAPTGREKVAPNSADVAAAAVQPSPTYDE
jgi:hypothetical protein